MEKIDKGFELTYWKLSNRRKFIRTLWMIPWAVLALAIIQIDGENVFHTLIWCAVLLVIFIRQLSVTYRRWKSEKEQINQSQKAE